VANVPVVVSTAPTVALTAAVMMASIDGEDTVIGTSGVSSVILKMFQIVFEIC
jgi:hypothetical protein